MPCVLSLRQTTPPTLPPSSWTPVAQAAAAGASPWAPANARTTQVTRPGPGVPAPHGSSSSACLPLCFCPTRQAARRRAVPTSPAHAPPPQPSARCARPCSRPNHPILRLGKLTSLRSGECFGLSGVTSKYGLSLHASALMPQPSCSRTPSTCKTLTLCQSQDREKRAGIWYDVGGSMAGLDGVRRRQPKKRALIPMTATAAM